MILISRNCWDYRCWIIAYDKNLHVFWVEKFVIEVLLIRLFSG